VRRKADAEAMKSAICKIEEWLIVDATEITRHFGIYTKGRY